VLAALFTKNPDSKAALFSMIAGGTTTTLLVLSRKELPLGLDANIFGIALSLITYIIVHRTRK
jgi:SSS family solute:Na+ symporter